MTSFPSRTDGDNNGLCSQTQSTLETQRLNRYGQGGETAFRERVDRYKSSLYAFLRRFLHHHDRVEDVFQETFLQAYTSPASFDTDRPLGLTQK